MILSIHSSCRPSVPSSIRPSIRPVMVCLLRRGGENSGVQTRRMLTYYQQFLPAKQHKKFQIKKEEDKLLINK
jgi:hypothetical protein